VCSGENALSLREVAFSSVRGSRGTFNVAQGAEKTNEKDIRVFLYRRIAEYIARPYNFNPAKPMISSSATRLFSTTASCRPAYAADKPATPPR
jgi:hypothetical protein